MADRKIRIIIEGEDAGATRLLQSVGKEASGLSQSLSSFGSSMQSVGTVALGAVGGGLLALGGGMAATAFSGLSLNSTMENVTAQLNAFTKDGAKSAQILEMIRDRAAKTPFEFDEMASSAASLLPASKASGQGLESLIEKAEILAASNPSEGLEGAAFALREAVSGDFTSIIERFNLPRTYINKLKDDGVPALEIVSRAMKEVGFDTDLVSNLAETASGRWSTFKDTFQTFAATITKPIFDTFSNGLGSANKWLEVSAPKLNDLANIISITVDTAVHAFTQSLGGAGGAFTSLIDSVIGGIEIFSGVTSALITWGTEGELLTTRNFGLEGSISEVADSIVNFVVQIMGGVAAVQSFIAPIVTAVAEFLSWKDVMVVLGVAVGSVVLPALATLAATLLPIVASVGAVIAASALLRNAWESDFLGMRTAVTDFANAVTNLVGGTDFSALKNNAVESFSDIGATIKNFFSGDISMGGIASTVGQGLDSIKNALAAVFGSGTFQNVVGSIAIAWNGLVAIVQSSFAAIDWTSIGNSLIAFPFNVAAYFMSIDWSGIGGYLTGFYTSVTSWFAALDFSGASNALTGLSTSIWSAISGLDWSPVTTSFDTLKTSVVSALEPVTTAISEKFTAISTAFSEFKMPTVEEIGTVMNGFRDGALGGLTGAITGIDWSGIVLNFAGLIDSLTGKINAIDWSQISVTDIGIALAAVVSPSLTAGIAALTWVVSSENFSGFVSAVTGAFASIPWGELGTSFVGLATAVGSAIAGLDWSPVTTSFDTLKTSVVSALEPVTTAISEKFTAISTAFSEFKMPTVEEIGTVMNGFRDGALGGLTGAITGIDWSGIVLNFAGLIDSLTGKINAIDWSQISVTDIGIALAAVVSPSLTAGIAALTWVVSSENFSGFVSAVTGAFASIPWGELGTSFVGLATAVGSAIAGLDWSAVSTAFDTLKTSVSDAISPVSTAISDAFATISTAIGEFKMPTIEELAATLNGFRDTAVQSLADAFTNLDLTGKLSGLLTSLTTAISGVDWSSIGAAAGTALSAVLSPDGLKIAFVGIATAVAPALTASIAGISWVMSSENFSNLTSAVMGALTGIDWSTVGEKFGTLKDAIVTALGDFAGGFTAAFTTPVWLTELTAWVFPSPTELISWTFPDYKTWTWAPYLTWTWVPYLTWTWVPYNAWVWAPYKAWTWPDIPTPAWLSSLLSWSPSLPSWMGGGDTNAVGTNFWGGGVSLVGETGPELVYMPRGSKVAHSGETRALLAGAGGDVQVNVYATVANGIDVNALAYEIADVLRRRNR